MRGENKQQLAINWPCCNPFNNYIHFWLGASHPSSSMPLGINTFEILFLYQIASQYKYRYLGIIIFKNEILNILIQPNLN
jgi:hypothetical protein